MPSTRARWNASAYRPAPRPLSQFTTSRTVHGSPGAAGSSMRGPGTVPQTCECVCVCINACVCACARAHVWVHVGADPCRCRIRVKGGGGGGGGGGAEVGRRGGGFTQLKYSQVRPTVGLGMQDQRFTGSKRSTRSRQTHSRSSSRAPTRRAQGRSCCAPDAAQGELYSNTRSDLTRRVLVRRRLGHKLSAKLIMRFCRSVEWRVVTVVQRAKQSQGMFLADFGACNAVGCRFGAHFGHRSRRAPLLQLCKHPFRAGKMNAVRA